MTERALLATACEQFLGREQPEICGMLLQTLDGHLRAIMGGCASAVHTHMCRHDDGRIGVSGS
jgi:uncharacterized membrane protein YqiK